MHLPHPVRVTAGQIVIDRHNMHALAFERIQIGGQSRNQRLSFTGFHFCDSPLMQDNAADYLHTEVLHVEHPSGRLSDRRISVHQNIVQRTAFRQLPLKMIGSLSQLGVRFLPHFLLQCHDGIDLRVNSP